MSWQDDPQIREDIRRRGVRARILRSAFVWTPLFLVAAGAALFYLFDTITGGDRGGTWVLVVIVAILAGLCGFQSMQALLDLRAEPRQETGFVTRRWSRSDSLVIKSHYVRVGKRILRGDVDLLIDIKEGDYVAVSYYANSAVILWIEKEQPPLEEGGPPRE